MNSEDFDKLKKLFEEFDGRPNHLAKFLLESKALSDDFIDRIYDSTTIIKKNENPYFKNISEMNSWYKEMVDDLDKLKKQKNEEELFYELSDKLNKAIRTENFEEACRIRDYMRKNGYKNKQ